MRPLFIRVTRTAKSVLRCLNPCTSVYTMLRLYNHCDTHEIQDDERFLDTLIFSDEITFVSCQW